MMAVPGRQDVGIQRRQVQGSAKEFAFAPGRSLLQPGQGFAADIAVGRDVRGGRQGDRHSRGRGGRRRVGQRQVHTG
jgi:hypothetical protein